MTLSYCEISMIRNDYGDGCFYGYGNGDGDGSSWGCGISQGNGRGDGIRSKHNDGNGPSWESELGE
jgi:hypothetical protein